MKNLLESFFLMFCIVCLSGCAHQKSETERIEPAESITEEINVEKRDLTHDGIADYIVTTMTYSVEDIDANVTLKDRISQQITHNVVCVKIYKGHENSDTYNEEELLWVNEYSWVHVGNGQLSIVEIEDEDYLLSSSFWMGQGAAEFNFEVFSLDSMGKKEVLDSSAISFEEVIDNQEIRYETVNGDTVEDYINFQNLLNKYINNGILIVACDIDSEKQFIRTQNNSYMPQDYYDFAFSKVNVCESSSGLQTQEDKFFE